MVESLTALIKLGERAKGRISIGVIIIQGLIPWSLVLPDVISYYEDIGKRLKASGTVFATVVQVP